jgi:hypothetical protein
MVCANEQVQLDCKKKAPSYESACIRVIPLGFFTNPGDRRAVDASANEQVHLSLFLMNLV